MTATVTAARHRVRLLGTRRSVSVVLVTTRDERHPWAGTLTVRAGAVMAK